MDIITIIQAVLRRWYVSGPIIFAAVAVAAYVQVTTPPAYEAVGQVLLADPTLDPSGLPTSIVSPDDLIRTLDEPRLRQDLAEGDATFRAEVTDSNTITLAVTAGDPDDAEATALAVNGWLREEVERLQAEAQIPAEEQIIPRGGEQVAAQTDDESGTAEATSIIELFDPTASIVNPFAASNATVRLLIVAVESDAGRLAVSERTGPGVAYKLSQSTSDAAPILTVTTTAAAAAEALTSFEAVRAVIDEELDRRQDRAEIPQSRRTKAEALAQPQSVTDVSPPVDRAAGAILGLGGLVGMAAAIASENIADRRRRRQVEEVWAPTVDRERSISRPIGRRGGDHVTEAPARSRMMDPG